MRIVHISDLHYTKMTWNPFRLLSKRFLGNLNWVFKRNSEFEPKLLNPLPQLFNELKVDLVLFGGDFTTTAYKGEYLLAQKFLSKISQNWIAIPGNHDHYTYRSFRNKDFYNYMGFKPKRITQTLDFFTLKNHGIEAHNIGSNWWVLALDTARPTNLLSSRGLFSDKLEHYFEEVLQHLPSDAKIIVLNHYPFFQNDAHRRTLERGEALMHLLKNDRRIALYLHGHTHRHTIADLQPNDLPLILDSGACTRKNKGTWNLIDLMDDSCEVSVYTWKDPWENTRKEKFTWTRN